MLPVYVATAMVVAHGYAAAAVAKEEALNSLDRGDIEKMRVWRTVAGVADLLSPVIGTPGPAYAFRRPCSGLAFGIG